MTTHRFIPTAWHNVLGTLPPALTVESGDIVVTETIDANGWDKSEAKVASGPNPMNGPIAVNADPRHLVLDLIGEPAAGPELSGQIRRYEWGPSFFVIYMALDRPVEYKAGPDPMKACYVHVSEASIDHIAANFVDPHAYFLGGGVTETGAEFRDRFLDRVRSETALRKEQAEVATFAVVPDLDMAGARGSALAALRAIRP